MQSDAPKDEASEAHRVTARIARSLAIDDAVKVFDAVAPQVRVAIFAHVDAVHIDTCVIDGISAEGLYSADIEARQRAYQDGLRVGRMSAAKAADAELAKVVSRLEALMTDPFWPGPGLRETALPTPVTRDVVDKLAELDRAAKMQGAQHGFTPTPMFGIAAQEIQSSRAQIAVLREALGWFIADPRFDVTVGGNPVVVEEMLRRARLAHEGKT